MRLLFLMASLLLGSAPAHATAFWTFNLTVNATGIVYRTPPAALVFEPITIPLNFNVTVDEFAGQTEILDQLRNLNTPDPTGLGSTLKLTDLFGTLNLVNGTITGTKFSYWGGPGYGRLACPSCAIYELSAPTFSVSFVSSTGGPGPVPEPATWAMMLAGFGMVGWALRRARQQTKVSYSFA